MNQAVLEEWVRLFDRAGTPASHSRLLRPLTTYDLAVLSVFARQNTRLSNTTRFWTSGFHEKGQRDDGTFDWRTAVPASLEDCILQGPHIVNGVPFAQQPRPFCKNNTDWESTDLENLPPDFVPRTNYQRLVGPQQFAGRLTRWGARPYTQAYREAHREFVQPGRVRTLQACILPPGPPIIGSLAAITLEPDLEATVRWAGTMQSLPFDYLIKVSGVSHIKQYVTDALPVPEADSCLDSALRFRVLRLNCLTRAYSSLWAQLFRPDWRSDAFVAADDASVALGDVVPEWCEGTPLRVDYDRWLALCEVDAIVALLLGLTEDQLVQMYRSQFPVLRKYEFQMAFDGNGRQISSDHHAFGFMQARWENDLKGVKSTSREKSLGMWARVHAFLSGDSSMDLGPFIPPFRLADREAAMRRAYRAFQTRLDGVAS